MKLLNLPKGDYRIKTVEGKKKIYDKIRKRFVSLTPEEWVRQNFINFLINHRNYPTSLISVEKTVMVNNLQQRADIIIYSKKGIPYMICECKAPNVKITKDTFEQVCRYNIALNTKIICVTNGLSHYCAILDNFDNKYIFVKDIPDFNTIID